MIRNDPTRHEATTLSGFTRAPWLRFDRVGRRYTYSLAGAVLSIGAPLGFAVIRLAQAERPSLSWLSDQIGADLAAYVYVTVSTGLVFSVFGYVLGRQADLLVLISNTDPLTGLHNRGVLHERIREEVARSLRYGVPLSLLLVDLDGLKQVNDRYGHGAGDTALRRVAEAIRTELRSTDVGVRWGGDEFALLAPNTSVEAAAALAERVRTLIGTRTGRRVVDVTASIGVATLEPREGVADAEALMRLADEALYEAKTGGRNRVVVGIPQRSRGPGRAQDALVTPVAPAREVEHHQQALQNCGDPHD